MKKAKRYQHKKRNILKLLFIIIFIICIMYFVYYLYQTNKGKKQYNQILDNIVINSTEDVSAQKTERMLQVEELKKENEDIVGWLEIPETKINFPVLQGSDNEYYMKHTYKKEYSIDGSIFLDKDYKWEPRSSNLLIYGHNNKNGNMFQDLLNYQEENYYTEHPIIRFTTIDEDCEYEIISVFFSRVYYKREKNVFRYYYFINAETESEYNNYIEECKKASLYDTGKTANYGEQLITLSTCSYHTEDGRFAIVARKSK